VAVNARPEHHQVQRIILNSLYGLPQEDEVMGEKCKGQRLCMSRNAYEAMHEQVEAKDREIAELRARLDSLVASKLDPPYVVLDESLSRGIAQKSTEVLQWQDAAGKAMRERDDARKENAELQRRIAIFQDGERSALQLAGLAPVERDEAREEAAANAALVASYEACVGRLYPALHAAVKDAGRTAHLDWIEALAATPEHLRGGV
jgi:hypothetical protein